MEKKLGVLGAGQLGKMLALAAGQWHQPIYILDEAADFPAAPFCTGFTEGNFNDFAAVHAFGKEMDVVTIEIEHVNTEALAKLEQEGIKVHPKPAALDTIKDKGRQKQFYAEKGIPTSPFRLFRDEEEVRDAIQAGQLPVPFVQKSRTAGYDGRGVSVVHTREDIEKLLPGPCVIEELVDIEKELAVIVARNENGEIAAFPVVEMAFNPEANLVEFLFCPARVGEKIAAKAIALAKRTIEAYDISGLLAVELFLDRQGKLLVNEVAPRTHNSGHHTIESCYTSQFEQHLRAVLNLPLGSTRLKCPAVMVNLLGEPGHTGPAYYEGLEECLAMEGVNIHIYGKKKTKPFRKMGHVTVIAPDLEEAIAKAKMVQEKLRVVTNG